MKLSAAAWAALHRIGTQHVSATGAWANYRSDVLGDLGRDGFINVVYRRENDPAIREGEPLQRGIVATLNLLPSGIQALSEVRNASKRHPKC